MMRACILGTMVLVWAGVSVGRADLVGYWNFDGQNLNRSDGTQGTMSAKPDGVLNRLTYGTGTTDNIWPPDKQDGGRSLELRDVFDISKDVQIEIDGLDMTGRESLVLSFAVRSHHFFTWNEHLVIEYSIDGGQYWHEVEKLDEPSSTWSVYDTGDKLYVLDDEPVVAVRLAIRNWVDIDERIEFDNIRLEAVPEPACLTVALLGVLVCRRRARRA